MKKLNITKEQFNRSRYFKHKYGKLEYVSESGKLFKTSKGKLLKFKESSKKFGKKFNEGLTKHTDTIYIASYVCMDDFDDAQESKLFDDKDEAIEWLFDKFIRQGWEDMGIGPEEDEEPEFRESGIKESLDRNGWAWIDFDNMVFLNTVTYNLRDDPMGL